jgi:hypothetical protein
LDNCINLFFIFKLKIYRWSIIGEKIYEITGGQPGLINGFAAELVKRNKEKPVITYQDYLIVEHWYLYETLDKNVSNVINKAKIGYASVDLLIDALASRTTNASFEGLSYIWRANINNT